MIDTDTCIYRHKMYREGRAIAPGKVLKSSRAKSLEGSPFAPHFPPARVSLRKR